MYTYAQKGKRSRARDSDSPGLVNTTARSRGIQLRPTLGNQAVQGILKSNRAESDFDPPMSIQPKLTLNKVSDPHEQEADRVAEQVMRAPNSEPQRSCACGGTCSACASTSSAKASAKPKLDQSMRHHEQLHMKRVPQSDAGNTVAPGIVHDVLNSPGTPIDSNTRSFMESHFGYDFGAVRIHSDSTAATSAREVNAKAYTVGRHIAMGKDQYAPHTFEGRKLLGHELTHVVHQAGGAQGVPALQRKPESTATPAKTFNFSPSLSGCNDVPFTESYVNASLKRAFEQTRDGNCIPNQAMKEQILSNYDGLRVKCLQDDGPCAQVPEPNTKEMLIFKTAYQPKYCPGELAAAIFHESVHFTQSFFEFAHGNISWDCQASCFPGSDPNGRGTASGCAFETGALPLASVTGGIASPGKGVASYWRFYSGFEKRRWIASYLDFSLGAAVSFIGETESGSPQEVSPRSTIFSLASAVRLDPGKLGGRYLSVSGGLGAAKSGSEFGFAKEVAISGGVRWRLLDVSVTAGVTFDPTREAGGKVYTLAATLSWSPKMRQ
jgi:hypothetical protein